MPLSGANETAEPHLGISLAPGGEQKIVTLLRMITGSGSQPSRPRHASSKSSVSVNGSPFPYAALAGTGGASWADAGSEAPEKPAARPMDATPRRKSDRWIPKGWPLFLGCCDISPISLLCQRLRVGSRHLDVSARVHTVGSHAATFNDLSPELSTSRSVRCSAWFSIIRRGRVPIVTSNKLSITARTRPASPLAIRSIAHHRPTEDSARIATGGSPRRK